MRLYYFTSAVHALSNIFERRIKISDVLSLNDPFEFAAINVQDVELRRAMQRTKATLAESSGIICFSRSWQHPMMWSHYADRHRGICLAFEVADKWCCPVTYERERIRLSREDIIANRVSETMARRLVSAKAHFWSYEDEVRVFCSTQERDSEGRSFRRFDDDLILKEVIIGPQCPTTRADLADVLGELGQQVTRFKSRAAFGYFEVCRNMDERL